MLVCFIVSPTVNAAALPTQEAAPQTNVQFQARNLLDQGVQAFKNGQYDEATQDFLRETARPQAFECPAVSGHGVCLAIHHEKHIHLRPLDPEPYYWIGVIDWTLAYRANGLLRAQFNLSMRGKQLSDTAPLPPELRDVYVCEYGAMIDEGIEALKHAIALRPNYDDAMA